MPITVGGTTITFNDATTQTTAFTGGGSYIGLQGRTFTTTGAQNWTVPTGITAVRVRVIGAGGGGGAGTGGVGGTGGTSSFGTYVSCTGGAGGGNQNNYTSTSAGGSATTSGVTYSFTLAGTTGFAQGKGVAVGGIGGLDSLIDTGCSSIVAIPSAGIWGKAGDTGFGGGGGGTLACSGASGAYAEAWITGLTSGGTIVVTVGTAGTGGTGGSYGAGGAGRQGLVIVEW
jgi:hypothetical protein